MPVTYKPVVIIMDDFTSRSLEYGDTTLYDAGYINTVTSYDYYTLDGFWIDGYGDSNWVETTFYGSLIYTEVPSAVDYSIADTYYNSNNFIGIYGYNAYSYDYLEWVAHESTGNTYVQHGDWVVDAFKEQLDSNVETILIDTDTQNGGYINSAQSNIAFAYIDTIVNDWLVKNNTSDISYVPVVLSASFGGSVLSSPENYAIQTLIDNFAVIVQSVPNVTTNESGGLSWGDSYSDIINVAAYNIDTGGDSLHGSPTNSDVIDIYANGYVEHSGWDSGWNFGTSFATPRVAAELTNVFVELLDYINNSLETGEITQEDLESSGDVDYSDYINSLLSLITTDIYVEIDNTWYDESIPVLSDNVELSALPVEVPYDAGNASIYSITDAAYTYTPPEVNNPPTVSNPIADASTDEDAAYSYDASANFADVDAGDGATYTATLADDTALPSWLSITSAGVLSGTPLNADVGLIDVKVTRTDTAGESASDTYTLTVSNTNDAPTVSTSISDASINEDVTYSYDVSTHFADVDVSDTLTYSAIVDNGDSTTSDLPTWLSIDSATGVLKGTPSSADIGNLRIKVIASDDNDASIFDSYILTINEALVFVDIHKDYIDADAGVSDHLMTLKESGSVWTGGENYYGQLGNGANNSSELLVPTLGGFNFKDIATSKGLSVALSEEGEVYYWGNGDLISYETLNEPKLISGLTDVTSVSVGYDHIIALTSSGNVYALGEGVSGELGTGDTSLIVPTRVEALSNIHSIVAGYSSSYALDNEGNVWSWGSNNWGSLGLGDVDDRIAPVKISSLSNIVLISEVSENDVLVQRSDGSIWAWGFNYSSSPVQISIPSGVSIVKLLSFHHNSFAISDSGELWGWGSGYYLGTGANYQSQPVKIEGVGSVIDIAHVSTSGHPFIIVTDDGLLWEIEIDITNSTVDKVLVSDFSLNDVLIATNKSSDIQGGNFQEYITTLGGTNAISALAGNDVVNLVSDSTWSSSYSAVNVGNTNLTDNSVSVGTNQKVLLDSLNRFSDVIDGGADVDTLNLTTTNDAFFIDDVYSDHHSSLILSSTTQGIDSIARIANLEVINAGNGNDIVDLTSTNFILANAIEINGGTGDDVLWGSNGNDTINGGDGNDTIFGGNGSDTLTGGIGADIFQFTATAGSDTINDFSVTEDSIEIYFRDVDNNTVDSLSLDNGVLTWDSDDTSNDVVITLFDSDANDSIALESLVTFIDIV